MNKNYLPYFDNLEQKYKDIYMEWSKEELIDHLVSNINNSEVLLSRIEKAKEYIKKHGDYNKSSGCTEELDLYKINELLEILNGEI